MLDSGQLVIANGTHNDLGDDQQYLAIVRDFLDRRVILDEPGVAVALATTRQVEKVVLMTPYDPGWRSQVYVGVEAVAEFRSADWTVPLSELYMDIPGLPVEPARESGASPESAG